MSDKDTIWFIEKWFERHQVMTKEHFDMLKEMVDYKISLTKVK